MRRSLLAWTLFVGCTGGAVAAYGCSMATGIPVSQRVESFFKNTVKPLWQHGFNAPTPEPERLEWIKPERVSKVPAGSPAPSRP